MYPIFACSSTRLVAHLAVPSIIGMVIFLAITALEYKILYPPFTASNKKALKYFGLINLIAAALGAIIAVFFRQLERYEEISLNNIYFFGVMWLICPLCLIAIEFFVYKKKHKDASKFKLSISLFFINFLCYLLFSFFIYFAFYLSDAQRMARRISCNSNLKSIGLVLKQYAIDHDGWLPDKSGANGLEQFRCNEYLTDYGVYLCPSTTTQRGKGNQPLTNKIVDYIYRAGLQDPPADGKDSSKIPVIWDKPTNHENYGNVLFLDGHVKGFEGANWMEQAGIKKNTVSIVDRIKILPSQPKSIFETLHKKLIEKIKDPVLKKIVLKKSFKKWGKYEDEYISFSYPNHPKIKLEVKKNIKYKDSPVIAIYRLMIGNYRYFSLVLKKGVKFDDNLCLCGAVAFRKCLFVGRTLLRFNLLHNGYVKQVQALSEKYRVDVERWTHLKIQQPVYIKISSSIRFKEPGNLQKLKKKISAQYKGFCFLRIGMNRKQILKLLGEPAKKEGSKYFYDYPDGRYLNRYTIEFNNNGRFEGFKKGWEKTLLLKPVFGSVDWVREKVGLFCVKKPEDYYKSSYPGAIVEYKLAPFTAKDTKEIFDIFIKKLPNIDEDELFWLCDSVDKLAEHGYTDDRIIPYLSKECLTKIMPYSGIDIIVKYRPKNRNQLLIRQVELLYKYCDNPNCKRTYPLLFSTAIDNLLLHSPEKAHELVLSGIRHPNSEMRWRAYMFWTKLPANKVISLIRQGLKDKDSDIRSRCAVAFKSIGTKQDLKLLRDALKTEKDKEIKENLKKVIDGIQKGKKISPKSMFYGE